MAKKQTNSTTKLIICAALGILFLIVGFTQKGGAAVLGVIIGLGLLAWPCLAVYKKMKSSKSTTTVAQKRESKPAFTAPGQIDGAFLKYRYSVNMEVTNYTALLNAAKQEQWQLSPKLIGDAVHLFAGNADVGIIRERADMIKDWIRHGDPYIAAIQNLNTETKDCTVFLGFYQDRRKGQEYREQSVVTLQPIKNEEKQLLLSLMSPGFELDFDEDDDRVYVMDGTDRLGRLPRAIEKKYIDTGAFGVFFEGQEEDDETGAVTPSVRIYW